MMWRINKKDSSEMKKNEEDYQWKFLKNEQKLYKNIEKHTALVKWNILYKSYALI